MNAQNSSQSSNAPITLTKNTHAWPESIDIDRDGNIYFTDAYAGTLYRLARKKNGELETGEEHLIEGLKRASGISIDQDDNSLYMGLVLESDKGKENKIARIPLDIFTKCDRRPYSYEALKVCARTQQIEIKESNIDKAPNGVIYHDDSKSVYYTHEALSLFGWLTQKKGHIGRVKFEGTEESSIIHPIFSPNGIDVEPVQDGLALIVVTTLDNRINRIVLRNGEAVEFYASSSNTAKSGLLGNLPDGLIRRSDGSLLVAAFGSGKVFYLSKQGNHYSDPVEIAAGLGNPTDLILAKSSTGSGTSLYVTTKSGGILPWKSVSRGRVIEIGEIKEKIELAKNHLKSSAKQQSTISSFYSSPLPINLNRCARVKSRTFITKARKIEITKNEF
jgi:sugar lactone lactonase YvrE